MILTFYGVRGSIPAPGPETVKYGGNTSCIHIRLESGSDLILDSGTGIRQLGRHIVNQDRDLFLLLSHRHWDHIQGFPFFLPVYQPGRKICIYSGAEANDDLLSILRQMDGATFPVHARQLPSRVSNVGHDAMVQRLQAKGVNILTRALNHPGGGQAFRIEEEGVVVAYVTDNELDPPGTITTRYESWVEFCRGADLLIHDAQYTESDMPHKHGWGHSLISQVRRLAVDAEVRNLVMFHHDPERTDFELEQVERDNDAYFRGLRAPSRCIVSFEGLSLRIRASDTDAGRHFLEVL
ncbi:MAG: MBL fold metallo-hydrolase [Chromatiales bacterium]|nr:MBL fold metallo-hydrolase [Chromatiales bacterium]